MENCIFCKIGGKVVESAVIWEDENFLAVLDINPNTKGMTLVIPKTHYGSYVLDIDEPLYSQFWIAVKKVGKILEKGLNVQRVAVVMEGLGVNHAHIKLYPIYGLDEKFQEIWAQERVFFETYEGYISTQLGPEKSLSELQTLAEVIKEKSL